MFNKETAFANPKNRRYLTPFLTAWNSTTAFPATQGFPWNSRLVCQLALSETDFLSANDNNPRNALNLHL